MRGPMIVDVTAGCSNVQARARWGSVMPRLAGQLLQLVDEVELAGLAGCVGSKRAGMRRARPVVNVSASDVRRYLPLSQPPLSGLHTMTPMP